MAQREIRTLLALVEEGYEGPAWHGPSLKGSLRGVTAAQAAWRPADGRHNIWEVVVHAAYWKYTVRRRITGASSRSFGEKGSNWFVRPMPGGAKGDHKSAWRRDLALLARTHRELRSTILELADSALDRGARSNRCTDRRMIAGIAMHDVYHAGQIELLRRLEGLRTLTRSSRPTLAKGNAPNAEGAFKDAGPRPTARQLRAYRLRKVENRRRREIPSASRPEPISSRDAGFGVGLI